jgi:hypothetical protein
MFLTLLIAFLLAARAASSPASAGAAARAAAAAARAAAPPRAASPGPCLPQLPSGTHFGVQYSRPAGAAGNATDALFAVAAARGARLLQLSLPWADIETTPSQPNFILIAELLNEARAAGLIPLFQIAAIDTEHAAVPTDLADPTNPTQLRPGLHWNDTEVV